MMCRDIVNSTLGASRTFSEEGSRGVEFPPLSAGWPPEDLPDYLRGGRPNLSGRRGTWGLRRETVREMALGWSLSRWGGAVYIGITPCGSVAKIGWSCNPINRLRSGFDVLEFARAALVERPMLVRAYPDHRIGGLEREAHRFMRPDRIGGRWREWYRVGPRLRALIRQLDDRYREDVLWLQNTRCDPEDETEAA